MAETNGAGEVVQDAGELPAVCDGNYVAGAYEEGGREGGKEGGHGWTHCGTHDGSYLIFINITQVAMDEVGSGDLPCLGTSCVCVLGGGEWSLVV